MTLWFNAKCSKCQQTRALLESRKVTFNLRAYLDEPPTQMELEALVTKLGDDWPKMIRPEAGLKSPTRDQVISAIAADTKLLERPILETSDRAVLARPPELALKLV